MPANDFDAYLVPAKRREEYKTFWNYYRGEHEAKLTDRARKYLEASGLSWSENFAEVVADALAERLAVTGFLRLDVEDSGVETYLDDAWRVARLDRLQSVLHTLAVVCGDAYATVGWTERGPTVAVNRPELIQVEYSDADPAVMEWAAKIWRGRIVGPLNPERRAIERLNVYWPDRIEKFYRLSAGGGDWVRWRDEGETGWPLPWVDSSGAGLGIPVVHFRHKAFADEFGFSELRSVIPQQDLLNKQLLDLCEIMDYLAWPQRWVTGVSKESVTAKPAPGHLMHADSPDAKFGQFPGADLAPILDAIEQTISRIARRSRTPLHLLTGGDMPSGEALRAAESGLVAKVEAAQTAFGASWEALAELFLRLGAAASKLGDVSGAMLDVQWRDPHSRGDKDEAEKAEILSGLGVSRHTLLTRLGYDPEHESEMKSHEGKTLDEQAGALLDAGIAGEQHVG